MFCINYFTRALAELKIENTELVDYTLKVIKII